MANVTRIVKFELEGNSSRLVWGRPKTTEQKRDDETSGQFEERTWKERAIVDEDGHLAVNSVMVHRSLCAAGAWLSQKLKGNKTFTDRFVRGVAIMEPFMKVTNGKEQSLTLDDVKRLDLYVHATGDRKSANRVWRYFPYVPPGWKVAGSLLVLDEAIDSKTFLRHLQTAGLYDGLGSFRAGKGGPNGRFTVKSCEFSNFELA